MEEDPKMEAALKTPSKCITELIAVEELWGNVCNNILKVSRVVREFGGGVENAERKWGGVAGDRQRYQDNVCKS